jgi:hypothetical protein
MRDRAEVLEGTHVPVEKAHLVLPRVEPREVATRVHQPHHEHPGFASLAGDVDEHLEEIDLRQLARLVHQRSEDLLASSLPLGHQLADHAIADGVPLRDQQLVQPRCRQLLLAAGPARSLAEQLLEARPDSIRDGMAAVDLPSNAGFRVAVDVPAHRISRNAHLAGHPAHRAPLHQHLVSDNVNLVHPQHPPAEAPAPRAGNPRSLGWISFSPPNGSLSRRHDHLACTRTTGASCLRPRRPGCEVSNDRRRRGVEAHDVQHARVVRSSRRRQGATVDTFSASTRIRLNTATVGCQSPSIAARPAGP